jgi:O-antigen/teichoic acid export membrane protein
MFTSGALKTELGYFSIAAQVFDTVSVVPASIAAVLFPVLMKLDVDRWRQTLRYMLILMLFAIVLAGVLGLFANLFVDFLFGAKFAGAAAPIRVALPAAVFVSGTSVLSQYLATHGMPRSTAVAWLAAAAISLGLGPSLVRTHGAIGASFVLLAASGAAWLILLMLSLRVSHRHVESSI